MQISAEYKKEIYRKSIHLSSLWMPVLIYFSPRLFSSVFFAFILAGNIILEYGSYKKWKWAEKIFMIFLPTLRKKELQNKKFTVTGSVYVLTSAFLCSLFFAKPIAVIALSIMLVSDTFAALVGRAVGKHKIYQKKSVEGTLAFFASSLLVMLVLTPIHTFSFAGIIACIAATFTELFENALKIDDNLSIPLVVGIILTLL